MVGGHFSLSEAGFIRCYHSRLPCCLPQTMACIIYWQVKEIGRVILEGDPKAAGVDLSLLDHLSPIGWENVILYGEYVLNRHLVGT